MGAAASIPKPVDEWSADEVAAIMIASFGIDCKPYADAVVQNGVSGTKICADFTSEAELMEAMTGMGISIMQEDQYPHFAALCIRIRDAGGFAILDRDEDASLCDEMDDNVDSEEESPVELSPEEIERLAAVKVSYLPSLCLRLSQDHLNDCASLYLFFCRRKRNVRPR
jgi:hypothetical protein